MKSLDGMTPDEIAREIWSRIKAKAVDYKEFKRLLVHYAAVRNERLRLSGIRFEE